MPTPFDQSLAETALETKAAFQPSHPAIIVFVIIAKKMQQTMERKHTKLSLHRVACLDRLTGRNSCSNHDIAQRTRLVGGK